MPPIGTKIRVIRPGLLCSGCEGTIKKLLHTDSEGFGYYSVYANWGLWDLFELDFEVILENKFDD
jgi:hypothetical protein